MKRTMEFKRIFTSEDPHMVGARIYRYGDALEGKVHHGKLEVVS